MKTMKNIMKKLTILLALAALLGSCASMYEGIVYDASVPPEKSAKITLNFKKDITYNGVPVKCKTGAVITVPAGRAEFTGDTGYDREIRIALNNVSFSCVLEAGKEYVAFVEHVPAEVPGVRIWGVDIYEAKYKSSGIRGNKEKLVGFIPFDPQVTSRSAGFSIWNLQGLW